MTDVPHPNSTDPVADPRYPGILAPDDHPDVTAPPADGTWDTDPDLAPTLRQPAQDAPDPDEAWARFLTHDGGAS